MPCTIGDVEKILYTTQELNDAIAQTTLNKTELIGHENRITSNKSQIDQNTVNITHNVSEINSNTIAIQQGNTGLAAVNALANANKADIDTLNFDVNALQDKSNTNENNITQNRLDIQDNTSIISALPTTYANRTGDSSFEFKVADPISPACAINQSWGDDHYEFKGYGYSKAESDTRYAMQSTTYLKTETYSRDEIDLAISVAIATHKADASAHHIKT